MDLEEYERNEEAERTFNDKLSEKYFAIWDSYPIQQFTSEREGQALRNVAFPGARVLVVGSGGGRELPYLLEFGCEIVALDISPEMLRIGQERFPGVDIDWQVGNANQLEYSEDSFDVMVALGGVVNYLLSVEDFGRSAARILRPGGALVTDSFNSEFVGESPATEVAGRRRTPYSRERIEAAFSDGGFDEVSTVGLRYVVDLLPPAVNAQADHPARPALLTMLEAERALEDTLAADTAKMLLTTARMAS